MVIPHPQFSPNARLPGFEERIRMAGSERPVERNARGAIVDNQPAAINVRQKTARPV
jgi:hypothetical protein